MARIATVGDIGALVRAARTVRGWNQGRAAQAAGVSRRFVSRLESGDHANAELWRVLALLGALEVTLDAAPSTGGEAAGSEAGADPAATHFDLSAHLAGYDGEAPL